VFFVSALRQLSGAKWSLEERNYMAIKEQAYRIARNYGWTIEGGRMDE